MKLEGIMKPSSTGIVGINRKSSLVIIAFISSGIGAVLGLVAYVQGWFW
jgi:hypothetical protein